MIDQSLSIYGRWHVRIFKDAQHKRDFETNPQGVILPRVFNFRNGITNVGIHYVLEASFRSDAMAPVAQIAPWFAMLIDDLSYTAVAAADTAASHAGWIEAVTYNEAARPTIAFGAAALRTISAQVDFTMNATKTLRGIGVIDDDTKSGATGTLFSTALFDSPPTVVSGNVLTCNYSLTD